MERLRGKWVVLIGSEEVLGVEETTWVTEQARALVAVEPRGLIVTARKGSMTEAFVKVARELAPPALLPIVGVKFAEPMLSAPVRRCITEWASYTPDNARPGNPRDVQGVLDGHAVSVARMKGHPAIFALTREDDMREKLCRQMALDWNLMVVVHKHPRLAAAVPMPF